VKAPPLVFFLRGIVRGDCGHVHRTLQAAAKCYRREWSDCAMLGGYTDRTLKFSLDLTKAESQLVRTAFDGYLHGEKVTVSCE